MKRHIQNSGLKKWFGNYFVELEAEPLKAIDQWASAYEGCILSGGSLTLVSGTTYNVASALVVLKIDGEYKVVPLPTTNNVDVSVQKAIRLKKASVTGQYQNPSDLTIAYDYSAEIIDYTSGLGTLNQDYLLMPTNGGAIRSYADVLKDALAVATTAAKGLMSATDKTKLDGVATNANNYTHPSTHAPSIIEQDGNNRFVTDAQINNFWSGDGSTKLSTTKKVGIGTNSPSEKLEIVDGKMKITGGSYADGASISFLNYGNLNTLLSVIGQRAYSGDRCGIGIGDGTNDSMYIGNNGKIGIGINDPNAKIDILFSDTSPLFRFSLSSNPDTAGMQIVTSADLKRFIFQTHYSGELDNAVSINRQYAHIGLGTSDPIARLDILPPKEVVSTIRAGRISGESSMKASGADEPSKYLMFDSTGQSLGLNWFSADNVVMCNGGGNVGIGNTSPNEKLEVNGRIKASKGRVIAGNLEGLKTQNEIFDTLAPSLGTVGDKILITGGFGAGSYMYVFTYAERISSTVIALKYINTQGDTGAYNCTNGSSVTKLLFLAW